MTILPVLSIGGTIPCAWTDPDAELCLSVKKYTLATNLFVEIMN